MNEALNSRTYQPHSTQDGEQTLLSSHVSTRALTPDTDILTSDLHSRPYPDDGSPAPQPPQLLTPQSNMASPNPQFTYHGMMGTLPAPLHPIDMTSMSILREPQPAIISNMPHSYTWTPEADAFFHFHDHNNHNHNQPITTSTTTSVDQLLDLTTSIPPLPPPLQPQTPLSQPADGRTTLHLAVEHNRINIVQLLLSRGADTTAQDRWGLTALHIAASRGYEDMTMLLLASIEPSSSASQRADTLNLPDAVGCTALHLAAENGHAGVVEILCVAGANPRAQNSTGATALHVAAAGGHEGVMTSLFLAAATSTSTSTTTDVSGAVGEAQRRRLRSRTGLHSRSPSAGSNVNDAVKTSEDDLEDHSNLDEENQDAANTVVSTSSSSRTSNSRIIPFPLPSSIHDLPHILDHNGNTALHMACLSSSPSASAVNLLLTSGSCVDAISPKTGVTPLHLACKKGHEGIVALLLEKGANLNVKARCGRNGLHFAAQGGHDGVVEMLLGRGAELDGRVEAWRL